MKNKWLLIPILAMALPLVSCDTKDYKFDDPNAVIRNKSNNRGVRLTYPYESNAERNNDLTCYITDIDNIVIKNLKKAKFEKGKPSTPNPDKSIEFSMNSYSSKTSLGTANFTLYANGYITYSYRYIYNLDKGIVKTETFHFTFDAKEAENIIDLVYKEFDESKAEEERLLSKISADTFLEAISNKKNIVNYSESGDLYGSYYDDGRVISEFKKLDFTPVDYETGATSFVNDQIGFTLMDDENNDRLNFEGGRFRIYLYLDVLRGYAYLHFFGEDRYDKLYSNRHYYSLDSEQATTFLNNVVEILPTLRKTKN